MKRQWKLMGALLLAGLLGMATSCDNNNKPEEEAEANVEANATEVSVNATETGVWHYFSFTTNAEVGTGKESEDNAAWFARKDWDIAFNKYSIRTNSGEATTVDAQGGVYTFAEGVTFADATLPNGAVFATDKTILTASMGGDVETIKSDATVILFKKNADGSTVMPPVYLKAPIYAFRTADGLGIYKVEFLSYNAEGQSGQILFNVQKMN